MENLPLKFCSVGPFRVAAVVFALACPLLNPGLSGQLRPEAVAREKVYEVFFRELAHAQQRAQRSADPAEQRFFSDYHERLLRLKPSRHAEIVSVGLLCAAALADLDRKAAEIIRAAKARRTGEEGGLVSPAPSELTDLQNARVAAVREAIEAIRNSSPPPEFTYIDATIMAHVTAGLKAARR